MKNFKVCVNGRFTEIRDKLAELGYVWSDNKNKIDGLISDNPYIYVNTKGEILSDSSMDIFQQHASVELTDEQVLSLQKEDVDYIFKPYDMVLVRNEDDECWYCDIFSHTNEHRIFKFACIGGDWKQCIEFKGNEHLTGTTI